MRNLVWAGMFLLFTLVASTVAAAAMIGMPLAGAVQFGAAGLTIMLVGWCIVRLAATPVAPLRTVSNGRR